MFQIKTLKPKILWKVRCTLGEGTLWVREHNSIYFTDIKKKKNLFIKYKDQKKKYFQGKQRDRFFGAYQRLYIYIRSSR